MQQFIDSDTNSNIDKIPHNLLDKWSKNGLWSPFDEKYTSKTCINDGETALNAFHKYTDYYKKVSDEWKSSSNTLVLLPCGSSKPIGSSTIHQKKVTAIRDAGLENADIVVISEPCVIVPPEYRLSLPAVNYDFPPEYTQKEKYPEVFELFTNRLAKWLDAMNYDTIYPYLIKGHMNKFEAALEKMKTNPTVYSIPSASYNPNTNSYSGDRFKKQKDITDKVKAVLKHKAQKQNVSVLNSETDVFFQNRWSENN